MGGCASGGNKDTEIDLFLMKHYKGVGSTDKESYEISRQQWDPKLHNLVAKPVEDAFKINDEVE